MMSDTHSSFIKATNFNFINSLFLKSQKLLNIQTIESSVCVCVGVDLCIQFMLIAGGFRY